MLVFVKNSQVAEFSCARWIRAVLVKRWRESERERGKEVETPIATRYNTCSTGGYTEASASDAEPDFPSSSQSRDDRVVCR